MIARLAFALAEWLLSSAAFVLVGLAIDAGSWRYAAMALPVALAGGLVRAVALGHPAGRSGGA